MKQPVILMRSSLAEEDERVEASKYFAVWGTRMTLPRDTLVIGRYSVLPYYKELEVDLACIGSRLINTHREHVYIADLKNWYHDLRDLTFETWFSLEEFKKDSHENGQAFVLKGETNSLKNSWFTHMLADSRYEVDAVYSRLSKDSLIGQQDIYIRKYEDLKALGEKVDGRPITKEYRFFCLGKKILASGFYWSEDYDYLVEEGVLKSNVPPAAATELVDEVLERIHDRTNFVVVDVAETAAGDWKVVELNDGQMSGLSMVPAALLYSNLRKVLDD